MINLYDMFDRTGVAANRYTKLENLLQQAFVCLCGNTLLQRTTIFLTYVLLFSVF